MNVYLDNAATTPMLPEVVDAMVPFMRDHFGNPSSTHAFGRKTKTAIEQAAAALPATSVWPRGPSASTVEPKPTTWPCTPASITSAAAGF